VDDHWALALLGITVTTLTASVAGKYTGGGFIDSTAGGGQTATFGFNLEALDRDGDGQADRVRQRYVTPDGFAFVETLALDENGQVPGSVFWNEGDDGGLISMVFDGPYESNAGSGRVQVTLTAKNDSFGSAEDTIEISLYGGPYDGYQNAGFIKGGNIQWHPAKVKTK